MFNLDQQLAELQAQASTNTLVANNATNTETAKFWLNIGVVAGENFVKLTGIPLDTFGQGWKTKPSQAQQSIVDSFLASAKKLDKGQTKLIESGYLALQLVHVSDTFTPSGDFKSKLDSLANL